MTSSDLRSGFGLPSPEALEHLEQISPGFTKFLQKELTAHRESQAKSEAQANDARRYRFETQRLLAIRGQQFGFAIGVIAICAGTLAALFQAQIAGSFIGAGGVLGLVTVFVVKSQLSPEERSSKTATIRESLKHEPAI